MTSGMTIVYTDSLCCAIENRTFVLLYLVQQLERLKVNLTSSVFDILCVIVKESMSFCAGMSGTRDTSVGVLVTCSNV